MHSVGDREADLSQTRSFVKLSSFRLSCVVHGMMETQEEGKCWICPYTKQMLLLCPELSSYLLSHNVFVHYGS